MKLVKLINALPQSAPGNQETHYGHMCQIKNDGIYCEMEDGLANLFETVGRVKIVESAQAPEAVTAPDVIPADVEPQVEVVDTIVDVAVELGFVETEVVSVEPPKEPETIAAKTQGKRGPKPKNA